jgi:hypothetical protein
MNQGIRLVRFMKKTRGRKSREIIPLRTSSYSGDANKICLGVSCLSACYFRVPIRHSDRYRKPANDAGATRPHMLRPRTFRPRTIRPRTLFPDVFTSLYVLPRNGPQPTELNQPCIGWAFRLTYPNYVNGQSQPTELYQSANWLGI